MIFFNSLLGNKQWNISNTGQYNILLTKLIGEAEGEWDIAYIDSATPMIKS